MSHSHDWDEPYRGVEQLWSGRPNDVLVVEIADLRPGRALDVGCGEGADAIWLAGRGWSVTGIDVSQVALDRAAAAAVDAGVAVEWSRLDVASLDRSAQFELVSVHYPALLRTPGDEAIGAVVGAVAPGGTLLVVGHAPHDHEYTRQHGVDPADLVQPGDVVARLDDGWVIEVDEVRPRRSPAPHGAPFTHDRVVRARRRDRPVSRLRPS